MARKKKTAEPVVEVQETQVVEEQATEPVVEEPVVKKTSSSGEWKEKGFASPDAYEKFKNKF